MKTEKPKNKKPLIYYYFVMVDRADGVQFVRDADDPEPADQGSRLQRPGSPPWMKNRSTR